MILFLQRKEETFTAAISLCNVGTICMRKQVLHLFCKSIHPRSSQIVATARTGTTGSPKLKRMILILKCPIMSLERKQPKKKKPHNRHEAIPKCRFTMPHNNSQHKLDPIFYHTLNLLLNSQNLSKHTLIKSAYKTNHSTQLQKQARPCGAQLDPLGHRRCSSIKQSSSDYKIGSTPSVTRTGGAKKKEVILKVQQLPCLE